MAAAAGDSFYITILADTRKYDNKLNNFVTDLPKVLEFNTPHEICLTESIIPYNCLNVGKNTYLTILRLVRKNIEDESLDDLIYDRYDRYLASHDEDDDATSYIKMYVMYYAVRLRVPEGYYNNVNEFLDVVQKKVAYICGNRTKYLLPAPTSNNDLEIRDYYDRHIKGEVTDKYREFVVGHFITAKEIAEYKKNNIDWEKLDSLNNMLFFNRIYYRNYTGQVVINEDTSLNSANYVTELHMDKDFALLLGFNTRIELLYPNMRVVSPYQSRIIPNDLLFIYSNVVNSIIVGDSLSQLLRIVPVTKDAKFGSLIHSEYKNLQYLPLNTQYLNSIRFTIRNIEGNLVKFLSGPHTIVLNLHIRPIKRTSI
ncbi:MAG: hypothetical protein HRT42_06855 [Campylobacteraceae bacterium]|nr:hypothetical protein [Campylobacteraceae bacterium]